MYVRIGGVPPTTPCVGCVVEISVSVSPISGAKVSFAKTETDVAVASSNTVTVSFTAVGGLLGCTAKFAVQLRFAVIVTLPSAQSASPVQFTNTEPALAVAINETMAPLAWDDVPVGVVVPVPAPAVEIIRLNVWIAKFAVQLRFAFIVTLPSAQSASPVQFTKNEPASAVAINETTAPLAWDDVPVGVVVPVPAPAVEIIRLNVWIAKFAVQLRCAVIVTLASAQSASPVQFTNTEPALAVAINETIVPMVWVETPVGVVVPLPAPAIAMVRLNVCTAKFAVQLRCAVIVTLASAQSASPDQFTKTDPVLAVALKATTAPLAWDEVPVGVVVPLPAPAVDIVRSNV